MSRRAPKSAGASASSAGQAAAATLHGVVIAAHGRHYLVAPDDGGAPLQCFPRGKKSEVAVGDRVDYQSTSADQGVIVAIGERRNLLYRSDQFKSKLFAANLDQLLIVLATEPHFSEDLLGRALVAAEANGLTPIILLNKIDLVAVLPLARQRLERYRALGYTVLEVSEKQHPEEAHAILSAHLNGHQTILLGQSGMGKSTLVNLLIPDAEAATREISTALNSGRHTTTFTRLYKLPGGGALIDSPGFQEFGLYHLTEGTLERAFPEFRPLLAHCRFYNCHHLHEPGCAVLEAVADGRVAPERHALYAQLVHEISQIVR
ncbi:Small ribosomal subunit biogenesis GTPase RsgA [Paraburkholderia tropica]|uniref:ribosome small subunit-dependent GTPase A n=1 Tax=Paraburkholderia TaxID=1822464 RepID=UPI001CAD38C6|nr:MULTISPECIES: ribosome small subunit-dependent GTPase A [Paraburkholderia]CAG9223443.1 Small ribosomal subunit biogenesis GTPase RsgA [Paraburkholderia tropica]